MKIAVAGFADTPAIAHFGTAGHFTIYEWRNERFEVVEVRQNMPACHRAQHLEGLRASAALVADCAAVIVSGIGPVAQDVLAERKVYDYTAAGGEQGGILETLAYVHDRLRQFQHITHRT